MTAPCLIALRNCTACYFHKTLTCLSKPQNGRLPELPFFGVIFGHQLRVTIGACIRDLELIAEACDESDLANEVVYLPLT